MKKSHLVIGCVLNYEKMESEKLSQQIKELMDSAEVDHHPQYESEPF